MNSRNDSFLRLAKGLRPFQTASGDVYIRRPRLNHDGQTDYEEVPLKSQSTSKFLRALFSPLTSRGFVNQAELRILTELIEGLAIEQPIGTLSRCGAETMQSNLLLLGLWHLASHGPATDTPANLLAKVTTELRLQGVAIDDPSFPTTEDAFGRRASDLIPDAAKMGLVIVRNENDRPRSWTVYLKDDGPGSSDGSVGDVSPPSHDDSGTSAESDTTTPADTPPRKILALECSPSTNLPLSSHFIPSADVVIDVHEEGSGS